MVRGQAQRKKSGNRHHLCLNDANFGATGNLQAEQDQMDDSCKSKVLFGLLIIGNW